MSAKQYEVVVSDKVRQGLGRIIGFIAADSKQAAYKIKNELMRGIKSLEYLPYRSAFLEGEFIPYNKYRKLIISQRFLLIYQICDDKVYVDYVVDCGEEYQWLIR